MFPHSNLIDFSPVQLMPLAILSQANYSSNSQFDRHYDGIEVISALCIFGLNTMLLGAMPNNGWLETMLSRVSFLRH